MLLEPSAAEQELLAQSLERDMRRLASSERAVETFAGLGFFLVAFTLLAAEPPRAFRVVDVLICVVVLASATRVQFHVATGFTVPSQLAYVPLVFIAPTAIAPFAVALALVLARVPGVLRGSTSPGRLANAIGNAWFALGPAIVFAIAGTSASKAGAGLLMLALAAQVAIDALMSCARDAIEDGLSLRDQLSEAWVYGIDIALSPVAYVVAAHTYEHPASVLALLPLLGVFAFFARERRARLESLVELKDAYHGTALVLGDVVEADDQYTGEHSKSVVALAVEVGTRLGLDAERRRNLEFGALLHDVGKVAIPKEIINKPGKLDPYEWTIIKTHTVEGQRMLDRVGGFMREVGLIVRSHHERWDGTGYPDTLAGEDIPLEARIISCCDAWNAMRSTRSYRTAMPHEDAIREIVAGAGKQFDPAVVEALLDVVDRELRAVA